MLEKKPKSEKEEFVYYAACNVLEQGLKEIIQEFRKEVAEETKGNSNPKFWGIPSVKNALATYNDDNSSFLASVIGDGRVGKTSLVRSLLDR